ncbi:hypothetical protein P171DRAFT_520700 [Karstenula rhodostoma CBS 690.94]|uniref:Uncharacterized protein n=1 Tax=Karstenula rhodostoma CBS 690.94 TaxID=1392251 RepID=A0A9P4UDB6_9PLEO|nr:hypothetical protein P171DRAFT_520700 [Karstenula rhodostoma CBS 690.94]
MGQILPRESALAQSTMVWVEIESEDEKSQYPDEVPGNLATRSDIDIEKASGGANEILEGGVSDVPNNSATETPDYHCTSSLHRKAIALCTQAQNVLHDAITQQREAEKAIRIAKREQVKAEQVILRVMWRQETIEKIEGRINANLSMLNPEWSLKMFELRAPDFEVRLRAQLEEEQRRVVQGLEREVESGER